MRGRHCGRSSSERRPCFAVARATRPTVATKKLTMMMDVALVMFLCLTSSVLGAEVKGLGFYPPFQTFNARGIYSRMATPTFIAPRFVFGTAVDCGSLCYILPNCSGKHPSAQSQQIPSHSSLAQQSLCYCSTAVLRICSLTGSLPTIYPTVCSDVRFLHRWCTRCVARTQPCGVNPDLKTRRIPYTSHSVEYIKTCCTESTQRMISNVYSTYVWFAALQLRSRFAQFRSPVDQWIRVACLTTEKLC